MNKEQIIKILTGAAIDSNGRPIAVRSETELFRRAGVEWRDPWEREI